MKIKFDPRDYTYDIETYPNCFTFSARHVATGNRYRYEISDRRDDREKLFYFLNYLRNNDQRMVGFNNLWFDNEVVQWIYENPWCSVAGIYNKAMSRIKGDNTYPMWADARLVKQIDLLKIHHYDNKAKATSLKSLEIAMRMKQVEDLPFPVGTHLTNEQKDILWAYNDHDVDATTDFYIKSYDMIAFREELSEKYDSDFMNLNDTKIGSEVLIHALEKAGVQCYGKLGGKRIPRQTPRSQIVLAECILPYIRLEHPAFQMVQNYLMAQTIKETKGVFSDIRCTPEMVKWMDPKRVKVWLKGVKKPRRLSHLPADADLTGAKFVAASLHCRIDGFNYDFGTGGLHASLHRQIVRTGNGFTIVDLDVASYYTNLSTKNRIFPAHLSEVYCDVSEFLFNERNRVGKKTMMGGAYKLALNGTYGNSNNEYSVFYDPMYTMKITINGQLSLCMLVEQLLKVPGLQMIQCNTDGITFHCPDQYLEHANNLRVWWEQVTKLELEENRYDRFFIRDVNSYIAEYSEGYYNPEKPDSRYKRKGAYEYKREWHKDHSALVVQKAVEARMVHGADMTSFIINHRDEFDFMIRGKVNRDSSLHLVYQDGHEEKLSNTIRYYVTQSGGSLVKRTAPKGTPGTWKRKNKITDQYYDSVVAELLADPATPFLKLDAAGVPHDERIHTKNKSQWGLVTESNMCSGQTVADCSDFSKFDWSKVNYLWYVFEACKLLIVDKKT